MANATQQVMSRMEYWEDPNFTIRPAQGGSNAKQYQLGQLIGLLKTGAHAGNVTDFDDTLSSAQIDFLGILTDPGGGPGGTPGMPIANFGSTNVLSADPDGSATGAGNRFTVCQPRRILLPLQGQETTTNASRGAPVYAYDNKTATMVAGNTVNANIIGWFDEIFDNEFPSSSPWLVTGVAGATAVWFYPKYPGMGGAAGYKAESLPLDQFVEFAAPATNMSTTPTSTKLGLTAGIYLTSASFIASVDSKTASNTMTGRYMYAVPAGYLPGSPINILVTAGMGNGLGSAVADGSSKIRINCVRQADPTTDIGPGIGAGGVGQQSCNSMTNAVLTFALTPTNVVAGDILDIKLTNIIVDSATATPVITGITKVQVACTR